MCLYLTDPTVDEEVKARHLNRYMTAIAFVCHSGGKWLDAACGSGYGTFLMAEYADVVYGMDRDKEAIEYARQHYQPPVDEFVHRDILVPNLDPLFGNFDVILSVETIEHLNQKAQMAWIRKVGTELMGPSGVFVVTTPIRKGGGPNPLNPKHLWEPDKEELLAMLRLYFTQAHTLEHRTPMTTGEEQLNLYVRCERLS